MKSFFGTILKNVCWYANFEKTIAGIARIHLNQTYTSITKKDTQTWITSNVDTVVG